MISDLSTWQITLPLALAAAVIGYLLGSIPFGLILTRAAGLGDVRSIGSGNIGATNVLRTGNKKLAAATLLLDALKATAAAWIMRYIAGPEAGAIAGLFAFLGHLFPVWLGFKGGKGVATYIGTLLGIAPLFVLVFAAVWLAVAFIFRYSSLAALTAMLVIPVALWILGAEKVAAVMAIMTVISYYKHKANISRLLSGTESKIGAKG
ncbi:glycerol-3-phosphate 1-O-acyltransferase PlsY [Rhizobium sp. P32RR-XVIII]|uniref:glycerol-3-phosphate 1-O-acyltransferase PlsY n=1 Tax=Rhizobium sp. P32RR-XVIII TaxID=2726738 RepID=UPI001456E3B4|nr:glycerol-3-phosphate 1-O-acyltransferase PlsY [Rhizobium sp. P32RR-XVIII]NLS03222.1 glycerol-3-phosphate 1-O-acyltransferase PlsY [Rhizobium sp. P32RR-XVIII]